MSDCSHTQLSRDPGFIWRCVRPEHKGDSHYMRRFATEDKGRHDPRNSEWLMPTPTDPIPDALEGKR